MVSSLFTKIFINQSGAIKPPWIHKDTFYKLVFNFCDRWCERCKLSGICRVYQKEREREKRFIKQGIDPKSWEATFITVKESFQETLILLEKEMKRLKIKITEEDSKRYEKEDKRKEKSAKNDRLYNVSLKLNYSLVKLVEDLNFYFLEEKPKNIEEPLEILSYYMHFISAKIHRAVLSEIEEKEMKYEDTTYDSKTSAFLSYVAIVKIINALKFISHLKNLYPKLHQKTKKLIPLFEELNGVLEERFELDFENKLVK
jgi:hypothetical protein